MKDMTHQLIYIAVASELLHNHAMKILDLNKREVSNNDLKSMVTWIKYLETRIKIIEVEITGIKDIKVEVDLSTYLLSIDK